MKSSHKRYSILLGLVLGYFILNAFRIFTYASVYFEEDADVAIVLGAGTNNGQLSPIFKERINHSILLYNKGVVGHIIFTGGFGNGQEQSDSQTAKLYAINNGIPAKDILIEESSKYTTENLKQAKQIMEANGFKSALLVSDPLHMKRAIKIAQYYQIDCKSSPTKTSMYQSTTTRAKQLFYETFYFSLREPLCLF